jgi:hypothetical protein
MLNHNHNTPKKTHVVSSLGVEHQALLLLTVSNLAPLFRDMSSSYRWKCLAGAGNVAAAIP